MAQATAQAQATPALWGGTIGNFSYWVHNAGETQRLPWQRYPRETQEKFLVVDLRAGPLGGVRQFRAQDVTILALEGSTVEAYHPLEERLFSLDIEFGRTFLFTAEARAPGRFWLVFEVPPEAHTYRLSIWNPWEKTRGTISVPLGGSALTDTDPGWPVVAIPPLPGGP